MVDNVYSQSRHAWSFMSEKDVALKLDKLGLVLNRPEPALICRRCKYALQPSGVRVSRHLAEKHNVPASDRTELATYIDSLCLPNPNLLNGRSNGGEPHPHLLISRGATCNHCDFHSKSVKLVQRHLKQSHVNSNRDPHWLRDGIGPNVSMQSWTQNGSRTYWTVDDGPGETFRVSDSITVHSPRRMKRLETLHEEERKRVELEQDDKRRDVLDTGIYDEAFIGNWMRRTDWTTLFSGANRMLLVRLAEAPAIGGAPLVYGVFDGERLESSAEDERRIRSIGVAIDRFFDICEDTVNHTGHSIRCWLRSHFADRPYKAPFQLPVRSGTRSRYRTLWRRLLYFCFRLYRLESTVRQNILRHEMTEEQLTALSEVWRDPCWTINPLVEYYDDDLDGETELKSSTRCSSMISTSSWSVESAVSSTSGGDSESQIVPAGSCKASKKNCADCQRACGR
jgi:hypothetical protein